MKTKTIMIVLSLILCFLLCGCTLKKEAITPYQLKTAAEKKDYQFMDISDQFKYDKRINSVSLVSTNYWHVEFYVFEEKEGTLDVYESNKISFIDAKSETSSEVEKHSLNYDTYSLVTKTEFMYLSRVDNTLMFVRVPVEYRDKVLKFLESVGY